MFSPDEADQTRFLCSNGSQIEAEVLPDISESFEVDAVPYFILLRVRSSRRLPDCPLCLTSAADLLALVSTRDTHS